MTSAKGAGIPGGNETRAGRVMPPMIETARLVLRAPRPGDGPEMNAAIRGMYEELHRWMPWADHVPTVEETEENCRAAGERYQRGLDHGVAAYARDGGEFVLGAGLHPKDPHVPSFEIGYWCRAEYQGQGYVSETVRALTAAAFETLGARRVQIVCDARNINSRRVAERCGYRLEAELRNYELGADGGLRDTLIFGMVPYQYLELRR